MFCKNMQQIKEINLHNKLHTPYICTPTYTRSPAIEQKSELFGVFDKIECLIVHCVLYVRDHEAFLLWRSAEVYVGVRWVFAMYTYVHNLRTYDLRLMI